MTVANNGINMKYRISILVVCLLLPMPSFLVHAEDVFVFHFDRTGDKIMFDSTITNPVLKTDDPSFSFLVFSKAIHSGAYSLDLYDVSGAKAVSTKFDIAQGKSSFEVPYFSIVNRFQVVSATGATVLQGDLSKFVTCNANGICEFEKGENNQTCLSDCASGNVKYSPQTQALLDKNNGVIKDPQSGAPILYKSGAVPAVNPLPLPSSDNTDSHPAYMVPTVAPATQSEPYPVWVVVATIAGFFLVFGLAFVLWRKRTKE